MVKKYDCTDGGAQFCQGCYTMEEESDRVDGNWVRAEDYDALAAELAETQRQLKNVAPVGRYNGRNIEEWAKYGAKLEAALRKYGNHSRKCDSFEDGRCRCGLSDILDARPTLETGEKQ